MNYSIYQDFKSRVYLFNPDNLIMYLKVLFFQCLVSLKMMQLPKMMRKSLTDLSSWKEAVFNHAKAAGMN